MYVCMYVCMFAAKPIQGALRGGAMGYVEVSYIHTCLHIYMWIRCT